MKGTIVRRPAPNELDHRILEHVGRLRFVTTEPLRYWCEVHRRSVEKRLLSLLDRGLVRCDKQARPAIWSLTSAGASLSGKPLPAGRHTASWSVMAHACHAAQLEIELHDRSGFKLFERRALLKQGFNPAHGEHAGLDRSKQSIFILLDDYGMQSDRITHVWTRRHAPHPKYWPDQTGRAWNEVVHRYVVVATDELQARKHQEFVEVKGVAAEVINIQGLWT